MYFVKKLRYIISFLILIVSSMKNINPMQKPDKGKEKERIVDSGQPIELPEEPVLSFFEKKYQAIPKKPNDPYDNNIPFFNQISAQLCEYLFLWCLDEKDAGPYVNPPKRMGALGLNYLLRLYQPTDFIVEEMLRLRINNIMLEDKKDEIIFAPEDVICDLRVTNEVLIQDILRFMNTVHRKLRKNNKFYAKLSDMYSLEFLTMQKMLDQENISEEILRYCKNTKQELCRLQKNEKEKLPVCYEGNFIKLNEDANNYMKLRIYFLQHLVDNLRSPLHEVYKKRCSTFLVANTALAAVIGTGGLVGFIITYFDDDFNYTNQMLIGSSIGSLGGFLWSAVSLCFYKKKCLPKKVKKLEELINAAYFDIYNLKHGDIDETVYFDV